MTAGGGNDAAHPAASILGELVAANALYELL